MVTAARARKILLFAGVLMTGAAPSTVSAAEERRYCFSDICPGDPTSILAPINLRNLGEVVEHPRSKEAILTLAAALPRLGDVDRAALAAYVDANGSLLVDRHTLPIVLKIDHICAPIGPFVAIFASESGHLTSVEFEAIASDGAVRLGVTRVARSFQVKAGSSDERALIADLSDKFGFRIDGAGGKKLPMGGSVEVTESFVRQPNGFQVSFARMALREDALEFGAEAGCLSAARIKID